MVMDKLKALRNAKPKEIPIATVKFSKEDMQALVDEKMKEIELDIQAIRNKAIDDFNNSIKEELDRFEVKNLDTCILFDLMDRKADKLKAGGTDVL